MFTLRLLHVFTCRIIHMLQIHGHTNITMHQGLTLYCDCVY